MRKVPPSASLRLRPYIRRELDQIDTDICQSYRKAHCRRCRSQEQTTREVSGATDCSIRTGLHGQSSLNLLPSTVLHWVCRGASRADVVLLRLGRLARHTIVTAARLVD